MKRESGGALRIAGEIVDFTGEWLSIRRGDRVEKYDAQRVMQWTSPRTASQQTADELFHNSKWAEAGAAYRRAVGEDQRDWMRRRILANLSLCALNLGDARTAGENFALVYRSDPTTPLLDRIPLNWTGGQLDGETTRWATESLQSDQSVKRLLGASWLLTAQPETAAATLQALATDPDKRIAQLADAQSWRARIVVADRAEVGRWESKLRILPAELRCGPALVVGMALERLGLHEDAAVAMMRAPVEHPRDVQLASQALLAAGGAMTKHGDQSAASRMYRELLEHYPQSEAAQLARSRIGGRIDD
ncbi:MAG: tetratricopeptide repeat protein [Planctomycetales bacterium]|nr:tetratricopeptide repeat protein [Planctomycetales bacterium]